MKDDFPRGNTTRRSVLSGTAAGLAAGAAAAMTVATVKPSSASAATILTPDWQNVLNFQADPTGVNDSTSAFQDAINAGATAGTGTYVPAGTYLITATLTLPANTRLMGDGPGSQIAWDNTTLTGPLLASPSTTAVQHVSVSDLRLSQNGASAGGTCIEATHFQFASFQRLIIDRASSSDGYPNIGVSYNSSETHYNIISDCVIFVDGANAMGIRFDSGATSNVVRNCRILPSTSDTTQIGVYVNAYAIELDRVDIENAAGDGISLGPGATSNRPTQIIAPYLEANGANIKLNSASAPAAFAARWTVVKPNATGRASTTTVAQDPDLALTMIAGYTYHFEMMLIYDGPGSATADLKLSLIAQGTPAFVTWSGVGLDTSTGITAPHGPAIMSASQNAGALLSVATAGVGTPAIAHIRGIIGPGNGGTFALQWAQRVSNATNVTLYAASTLTMEIVG